MPLQKYDVDDLSGNYVERYWSVINVPVLDARGVTTMLLHRVEDVSDYVHERTQIDRDADSGLTAIERAAADVYARAQELQAAWGGEARATKRLAALADVSVQLSRAQTVDDLAAIIVERGLAALGADGGGVGVVDGDKVHLTRATTFVLPNEDAHLELSLNAPSVLCVAAATGRRILLANREECLAFAPHMAKVETDTGYQAWAAMPLRVDVRALGAVIAGWLTPHAFPASEIEILDALAAQCAHGLERIQNRQVERASAAAARRMSETLQRALLTEPVQPSHLQIAVRYRPAAQEAEVGGDWYDAFVDSKGATCLVIGDVAGHDSAAAATMGQVRNLLLGIAYTLAGSPGAALTALDRAMNDLDVESLTTMTLAVVDEAAPNANGDRLVRWSNAGHPSPLLISNDGSTRLLHTEPDLLLGIDPDVMRADHEQVLAPGDSMLLYTDGLIERRGASLGDGMNWLLRVGAELAGLSVGKLCDVLLDEIGDQGDDDVALLALRAVP